MATREHRIVAGDESDIHEEPHIRGSRITRPAVKKYGVERSIPPSRIERHSVKRAVWSEINLEDIDEDDSPPPWLA